MKHSIFSRTYLMITVIILVSFLIFGGVSMSMVFQYATSEKGQIMQNDAQKVAQIVAVLQDYNLVGMEKITASTISLIAQNNDTNIIVTDITGRIVYCNEMTITMPLVSSIGGDIINHIIVRGEHAAIGTLGGVYTSPVYTAGVPILLSSGEVTGFVFVSSPETYFKELTVQFAKILMHAAAFVLAFAFIMCYFLSKNLVRPLKEMSKAANEFAKGNFGSLIEVKGEDEAAELAVALNNMAIDLAKAENSRSAFIANVSHDLKTPMTTISGFIDGILDGTIPKEKEDYYLQIIADETRRLSRMVKGLLDVARFEENKVSILFAKFDICSVISKILIGFEQKIEAKNIYVEVFFQEAEMSVWADYDMIFQVAYNLIDNAVKFANKDGIITVKIAYEGKKVRVHIKNTGEGIAQEDIGNIFERFYKADSSRGLEKQGVGLGLYLVRSMIVAHKETIDVDSVQGEYCEFSFTVSNQEK